MSSEALSEQSCVRKGAGYNEVYLSGQTNPGATYIERDSSANSPSEEEDEDLDKYGLGSYMDKVSGDEEIESLLRSVVGLDGAERLSDCPLLSDYSPFGFIGPDI